MTIILEWSTLLFQVWGCVSRKKDAGSMTRLWLPHREWLRTAVAGRGDGWWARSDHGEGLGLNTSFKVTLTWVYHWTNKQVESRSRIKWVVGLPLFSFVFTEMWSMCPQRMRSLLGQRVPELWAPCCLCQELGGKPRQCLVTYLQKAIFAFCTKIGTACACFGSPYINV